MFTTLEGVAIFVFSAMFAEMMKTIQYDYSGYFEQPMVHVASGLVGSVIEVQDALHYSDVRITLQFRNGETIEGHAPEFYNASLDQEQRYIDSLAVV